MISRDKPKVLSVFFFFFFLLLSWCSSKLLNSMHTSTDLERFSDFSLLHSCAIVLSWLINPGLPWHSLGLFSPIFERVWCECSPLPVGGTLCSELLQLGLSFTNSVLEPSEALYFYLCSATLTRCFRCDGTKRTLSQVLKLWWLVWMFFFFFRVCLLSFSQRDFFFKSSHWHYSLHILNNLISSHYFMFVFMCNNTCF